MTSFPLLPLDHKGLTRREAADFFRGLAEFLETYPTDGVVVTVHVESAITSQSAKLRKKSLPRG
jgi:hypothetical protein